MGLVYLASQNGIECINMSMKMDRKTPQCGILFISEREIFYGNKYCGGHLCLLDNFLYFLAPSDRNYNLQSLWIT